MPKKMTILLNSKQNPLEARGQMKFLRTLAVILMMTIMMLGQCPQAQSAKDSEALLVLRDAEIEEILKSYLTPLFKVAGLKNDIFKIQLVSSKEVNAMATSGYQLILFTGFLLRAENVGQVIGVLAHETGHIADGHVARVFGEMKRSYGLSIAHVLMGAAAAVAGSPEAGIAIGLGGLGMAQRNFLHYHRGQEAAADQDALRYMEKLGWSTEGLGQFLKILKSQDYFSSVRQDPYARTHPLTQERINAVMSHHEKRKKPFTPFPPGFEENFHLMQAKLKGYLFPDQALQKYSESDSSVVARYGRCFAYFRQNDLKGALGMISDLLKERPKAPFFWELKAQIHFEMGTIKEALSCYAQALTLKPQCALLYIEYAQALLEMNQEASTTQGIQALQKALPEERDNPFLWRLLAIAYGRQNKLGEMALALGEEAFLKGSFDMAESQVKRALKHLPPQSILRVHAQDLLGEIALAQ